MNPLPPTDTDRPALARRLAIRERELANRCAEACNPARSLVERATLAGMARYSAEQLRALLLELAELDGAWSEEGRQAA